MANGISEWLQAEPLPRELHARVMGDRRLAARGGGALRSRLAFATAALVVLLVGGGLGSILLRGTRPGGAAAVATGSPSPSASAAVAPSPTPPTATGIPTSHPSLPFPACLTADLTITIGQAGGAAGSIYVPFTAANRSTHACSLTGYFGLALLDAAGKQVGGNPSRDPDPSGTAPGPVVLAPGDSATFTFHWGDVQNSPQACPQATRVELTAPDQYDHVFIPARSAEGMTIAPCSPGAIGLTPVRAK